MNIYFWYSLSTVWLQLLFIYFSSDFYFLLIIFHYTIQLKFELHIISHATVIFKYFITKQTSVLFMCRPGVKADDFHV